MIVSATKYYIAYSAVSLIQIKVQGGRISILQDILGWAKGLPAWQSDAIARLFAKQVLSQEDLEDLYALLKAEYGIPDPKGRTANKLSDDQIPAGTQANTHVELLAIKNLRHVNAIAENQRLAFGAKGLTVIYGDNGSGKSGYTRVLKRACRARDQSEPIHPNAYLPLGKVGTAEAVLRAINQRSCQGCGLGQRDACSRRAFVTRDLRFALRPSLLGRGG